MSTYHVFVSHAWAYSERYFSVIRLLDLASSNDSDFEYVDFSVPKHDPLIDPNTEVGKSKLTGLLKAQIARASSIIVPAGMYVNNRYWIQKEIDLAQCGFSQPKKIIAIRRRGQERNPQELFNIADQIVNWNSLSLANAVAGVT
jgi:hypothetical protein